MLFRLLLFPVIGWFFRRLMGRRMNRGYDPRYGRGPYGPGYGPGPGYGQDRARGAGLRPGTGLRAGARLRRSDAGRLRVRARPEGGGGGFMSGLLGGLGGAFLGNELFGGRRDGGNFMGGDDAGFGGGGNAGDFSGGGDAGGWGGGGDSGGGWGGGDSGGGGDW